jgi:von Willebrand factor type A domain
MMRNEMNAVDLAFVVDTTGSMGSLIVAAQRQMITMLRELAAAADINLWLGVVEYRDHPPQDKLLTRVYAFTDSMEKTQKTIMGLEAAGGGDGPEAVLDGITAACSELAWWKHSRRVLILVGDAPPHGCGAVGDGFKDGCPCGETIASVTRLAEDKHITIHALGLTPQVNESFGAISYLTGGKYFSSQQGDQAENADLNLDELAERLEVSRYAVSTSLVRLLSRDLIDVPAVL